MHVITLSRAELETETALIQVAEIDWQSLSNANNVQLAGNPLSARLIHFIYVSQKPNQLLSLVQLAIVVANATAAAAAVAAKINQNN